MTYVIIGAGPAGVTAADTLRKADPDADVVMIGSEPEPPYSRMAIPYVLTGIIEEAGTYLRKDADHYDNQAIQYRQGVVKSVDPKAHTITLEDGTTQSYAKLLIATGASPVRPPIAGRASLLDSRRLPQYCQACREGRGCGADGRRFYRLHHHGSVGRAGRKPDGRRSPGSNGAADDERDCG